MSVFASIASFFLLEPNFAMLFTGALILFNVVKMSSGNPTSSTPKISSTRNWWHWIPSSSPMPRSSSTYSHGRKADHVSNSPTVYFPNGGTIYPPLGRKADHVSNSSPTNVKASHVSNQGTSGAKVRPGGGFTTNSTFSDNECPAQQTGSFKVRPGGGFKRSEF